MPYDLFISYSRRDNAQGRITQLVERIQADFAAFAGRPLQPFFDLTEIHGMEDWRHRILQGLRESRLLLACLSPSYLGSEYCEWEFNEYLKHEVARLCVGEGVAPIYFVEVPGWGDKGFEQQCAAWVAELRRRQHFDLRPWVGAGEEALREAAVREQMTRLKEQLAERIRRGERAEQSLGNVDAHNPHFIGRVGELRRLREALALGRVGVLTAVHGLGGVGKTALAIEYAHAFAHEYGGGRWQLRCSGKDDLRALVAELATPLEVQFTDAERLDLDLQFQRILAELHRLADAREPHRCLLVLDNVDQPKLLEPAQTQRLPAADWLHVLATTRLGENELFGSHRDRAFLPVDELPEDDALALIEGYQPGGCFASDAEWHAAREIVRLLGRFTLAIEGAAVYLGQFAGDVTCSAFLARLKREGLDGLDAAAADSGASVRHGEIRLSATLQPTLERLDDRERLALTYASLLAPDQVALPWIRALVAKECPEIGQDAEPGYPDPWSALLCRLLSLRLFQATGVTDAEGQPLTARIHRLVQELAWREMSPEQVAARQNAVQSLVVERVAFLEKTTRWAEARWEVEPLDALARLWAEAAHPRAAWLLNQTGLRWYNLAEWARAEPLYRRAHVIEVASFGEDHPLVATVLNNLALLLKATGRQAEAELLMRRALAIDEASFGKDNPRVATDLNNLALLLQDTNRLAEAEPLMRRALAIDEASFGKNHPDVARDLSNLATLLQATNRLVDAESVMRRALAIDEASFGKDHPKVATALNNLAQLLQATDRLAEAEPLMRRALAVYEASLGEDHPIVATALNNLALLLHATNRLAEAEPLYRRARAIDEASLGKDHPDVARDLNNLAALLQDTHRLAEAELLMRRALAIDEASLGEVHPSVATDLSNLAQLLQATNRRREAELLMHRALAIDETSLGRCHPKVAIRLNNLAGLLQDTDRLGEAEPLRRRALAIDEASPVKDHPSVAIDLNNLALLLQDTNRLLEAEPLMQRALSIYFGFGRRTGQEHPYLQIVIGNYRDLLAQMGRSRQEVLAQLNALAEPFGIRFGE